MRFKSCSDRAQNMETPAQLKALPLITFDLRSSKNITLSRNLGNKIFSLQTVVWYFECYKPHYLIHETDT